MHVPLKQHLLTVTALVGILVALLVLLSMMSLRFGPFYEETPSAEVQYLREEEVVVIESEEGKEVVVLPIAEVLFEYIEVIDGCGPNFEGVCLNMRSGPGEEYPVVKQLRNGVVLKVRGVVERDEHLWYRVVFDEWLRYPERAKGSWYVAADYVRALLDEGDRNLKQHGVSSSTKRIIVDRSTQMLHAYDGEELFMETHISTGIELTPTPLGTFTVFKKTPSRYMQGPIPGLTEKEYDLPGVPWNLYFTHQGAVIHGAYWHNNFGRPSSNGCVNLPIDQAQKLYTWAEVGMRVIVRD